MDAKESGQMGLLTVGYYGITTLLSTIVRAPAAHHMLATLHTVYRVAKKLPIFLHGPRSVTGWENGIV